MIFFFFFFFFTKCSFVLTTETDQATCCNYCLTTILNSAVVTYVFINRLNSTYLTTFTYFQIALLLVRSSVTVGSFQQWLTFLRTCTLRTAWDSHLVLTAHFVLKHSNVVFSTKKTILSKCTVHKKWNCWHTCNTGCLLTRTALPDLFLAFSDKVFGPIGNSCCCQQAETSEVPN